MLAGLFRWLLGLAFLALLVGIAVYLFYARDIAAVTARLAQDARYGDTRFGQIEYADAGSGPVALAIHGAGGGFDQGMVLARGFGPGGYRFIAPSRFGYLGSALPDDPSTAAQADAFVDLLDGLGIDKVTVLAMSGGVPPALQLAERYPDRVTALVFLSSAPFTPLATQQNDLPIPIWLYQWLFRADLAFWILQRLLPGQLEAAFDMPSDARATLPAGEIAFADDMMAAFLPVSRRQPGLGNEGAAIDPEARHDLAAIRAPVLVVHASDDGINPVSIAEYIAGKVPGAELLITPSGGHLLLGHHGDIRRAIADFLTHTTPTD
ncbi:MAG: alpha/beta fold hydrolase [Rhodobacteraceae bacterium]|nr:alpha/beta fold hydrolase [Paracoccaceae bacterium]